MKLKHNSFTTVLSSFETVLFQFRFDFRTV